MSHILTKTQKPAPSTFESLRSPVIGRQDLVIVGGGASGISAAMRLAEKVEAGLGHGPLPSGQKPRFGDLSRVSLLHGGESLAFSPVAGEFGNYLTLSGSDCIRRDETLRKCRDHVETKFRKLGFDFRKNSFAQKITWRPDSQFQIRVSDPGQGGLIETSKLILALGHTLKERPQELREFIIPGTNGLCQRLSQELPASANQRECMDRVLSSYKRVGDNTIRIAVVGLGSTFLEAVKIFYALLEHPEHPRGLYRTCKTHRTIELVLFDHRLTDDSSPTEQMLAKVKNFHAHLKGYTKPDSFMTVIEDVEPYKAAELHRITEFVRTNQLRIQAERFNWDSLRAADGGIQVRRATGEVQEFSCVLDCAPFHEGIDAKQKKIIEGIDALQFTPTSQGTWMTSLKDQTFSNRLALIGAAFVDKYKWGLATMNEQACRSLDALFPAP